MHKKVPRVSRDYQGKNTHLSIVSLVAYRSILLCCVLVNPAEAVLLRFHKSLWPLKAVGDRIMSNTTVIDFADSKAKGTVTLVANPFFQGQKKYFAKFDRATVNIDHLIARIQKKETGTDAIMAKHFASLFKKEILEALARGEAVNFLDLGTLYLAPVGAVTGNTPDTAEIKGFQVKFTASKLTNEAVSSVGIKKIVMSNSEPIFGIMTDLYTGEEGNTFTAGKSIRIVGTRLIVSGDEGGVFFAPVSENDEPVKDETQWIKVASLIRNKAKILEFFLPAELAVETPYCIVLKTNSSKGNRQKKTYSVVFSEEVTIKAL